MTLPSELLPAMQHYALFAAALALRLDPAMLPSQMTKQRSPPLVRLQRAGAVEGRCAVLPRQAWRVVSPSLPSDKGSPPCRWTDSMMRATVQSLALISFWVWATPAAAETPLAVSDEAKIVVGILSFLGGIIAASVGAIGIQAATQRRIQMDNVVQERAKWRDQIRCLASDVHEAIMEPDPSKRKADLIKLKVKFRTVLNPFDPEDKKIVHSIDNAYKCGCGHRCGCGTTPEERSDEFSKIVSRLLKHDWERAKEEVKHPLWQWRKAERGKRRRKYKWGKLTATVFFVLVALLAAPHLLSCYARYWAVSSS